MKEADPAYFRDICNRVSELLNEKRAHEETLVAELEEVRQEIVGLEQMLNAAAPFTSDTKVDVSDLAIVDGVSELPLADAIRKILDHNPQARTPRGIRDSLGTSGYDLLQHNNALASIHGVLKRMADSGEIERIEVGGKTRYRGKATVSPRPPFPPRRTLPNEGVTITEPLPMPTRRRKNYFQDLAESIPPPQRDYKPVSMVDDEGKLKRRD